MTGASRAVERKALLTATLAHVAFDGWTQTALNRGAEDAGLDGLAAARLFPGGATEMIDFFSQWADHEMVRRLGRQDASGVRLRERVAAAVQCRLEVLGPHREAVRRGLAVLALPTNAPLALRILHRTVDAIWYEVGDRSADFSYYTRRALLAAVCGATMLVWLDDTSPDNVESWAFLQRRIDDVMRIAGLRGRIQRRLGAVRGRTRALPGVFARR